MLHSFFFLHNIVPQLVLSELNLSFAVDKEICLHNFGSQQVRLVTRGISLAETENPVVFGWLTTAKVEPGLHCQKYPAS